jgi:hypothetical protein
VTRMSPLESRPALGDQIIPLAPARVGAGLLPGVAAVQLADHDQPHLFVHTRRLSRTFNAKVDTSGIGDVTLISTNELKDQFE